MNKIIKITNKFLHDNKLDQYLTKKYFDYGLIAFSLLLGFYLRWNMQNVFVFSFVIWIILNPISSKLLARAALYFLVFVPLLLIMRRDDRAEQFAILAYYFLILTVIMAIVEFKKEQKRKGSRSRQSCGRRDPDRSVGK